MTKALLLPFYCDGYREDIFEKQIASLAENFQTLGYDVTAEAPIHTYEEAFTVSTKHHPLAYDAVICMAATWSEPRLASVAVRAFFGKPIIVFGVNEFLLNDGRTEFSSAPASAALYGCFQEMGVPCDFFTGDPFSEKNQKRLLAIRDAAEALGKLRHTKIGFFGHNFNGITEAGFDLSVLRRTFGTEVWSFDGSQLIRKLEGFKETDAEYISMAGKVDQKVTGMTAEFRDKVIRMCAALWSFKEEYDLDAIGVRCHTEFSVEYKVALCLPLSVIGDDIIVDCEADMPVLLTELLFSYLAGGKTATYADLRTFTENGMDVGACGMCPASLTGGMARASGADGYYTNASKMNEGQVTIGRIVKRPGGKLFIHATNGVATDMEAPLREFGCAAYPMTHITP